jgi:hypothetical protein
MKDKQLNTVSNDSRKESTYIPIGRSFSQGQSKENQNLTQKNDQAAEKRRSKKIQFNFTCLLIAMMHPELAQNKCKKA